MSENTYKSYKDLKIWTNGIEIVELVYLITKDFPKQEQFGLTSQIRRCSISIPSNIAEGWGRAYNKSSLAFLRIARASLYELDTQLIISRKLNYIDENNFKTLSDLILAESKMLNAFMTSIKKKIGA